jgi:hypothetical protein
MPFPWQPPIVSGLLVDSLVCDFGRLPVLIWVSHSFGPEKSLANPNGDKTRKNDWVVNISEPPHHWEDFIHVFERIFGLVTQLCSLLAC